MLELVLQPFLPTRRATHRAGLIRSGYDLRLPDGPRLDEEDPLLRSFGVTFPRVDVGDRDEALQDASFDPGERVVLLPAVDGSDGEVSVWSADGVRMAGIVDGDAGEQLEAALDAGVPLLAVVLLELCHVRTGRRDTIDLLVAPAAAVAVEIVGGPVMRPARRAPRRLVLIADGRADLALWDPAGEHGPVDAVELGLSPALLERLATLRGLLAARDDEPASGLDVMVAGWEAEAVEAEARTLWRRLRAELGRRCEVGYLAPGAATPTWTDDWPDDEDDCGLEDDGLPF